MAGTINSQSLMAPAFALTVMLLAAVVASGQTTSFTYQGRLTDGGTAANGNYDLQFALWDGLSGGIQIGSTQTLNTVAVSNGVFTVSLDFGANSFPGANRFLEIGARPIGAGSFTLLTPRQPITSTPYAVRSASSASADNATNATNANTATNATQLGGVAANQYIQTNDSRLSDARTPTAGSTSYVQNTTVAQTNTDFNISGNGTAGGTLSGNVVNAGTQFNIGGARVFSTFGTKSLLVGPNAGANNASNGTENAFFGESAGLNNSTGRRNTYAGQSAGQTTKTGESNTLIGFATDVTAEDVSFATAIGSFAKVSRNNSLVLGANTIINGVPFYVGIGTIAPTNRLDVNVDNSAVSDPGITIQSQSSSFGDIGLRIKNTNGGNEWYIDSTGTGSGYGAGNLAFATRGTVPAAMIIHPSGSIELSHLGAAGGSALCLNSQNVIAACSSSLRYKTNVATFRGGLDIINRLRPISFTWKEGGAKDIGLGAEEVAKVEPLLTFRNDRGEIEGVKYSQLSAVFINAFEQQQSLIEKQQASLKEQETQIAALSARLRSIERALKTKAYARRH